MYRQKDIEVVNLNLTDAYVVIASDIHFPFQDNKAVSAFLRFCEVKKPDVIILNGDVLDFYKLSRFTKGEGRNPYQEMEECRNFLKKLRSINPKAKILYVIGNHETRLESYVLTKAPDLACLIEDVFTILKVDEFDVRGCAEVVINKDFVVTHGKLIGNKAGLSAIKEIEKHYMSGASGHVHRLAKFITRKAGRKFEWYETGCLCDLNPEYVQDPDWQHGFVALRYTGGKRKGRVIEIDEGIIHYD